MFGCIYCYICTVYALLRAHCISGIQPFEPTHSSCSYFLTCSNKTNFNLSVQQVRQKLESTTGAVSVAICELGLQWHICVSFHLIFSFFTYFYFIGFFLFLLVVLCAFFFSFPLSFSSEGNIVKTSFELEWDWWKLWS